MAERAAWAVSHNPGVMTTVDVRHSMGALWWPGSGAMVKRVGRVPNGSTVPLTVTATSPTPDGLVHVSPGYMVSMGTRSIAPYIQVLDAIKDINILSTPAHGSLTRWDLIIAQQNDELHSDADNTWTIKQVVGDPSATPSDPAVTGSPDYVVIARVVVGGGVTSISQGNITQLLTNFTVPIGGLLPVADQSARDALTGTRHDGMAVWRMDRDWIEVFDGSGGAWRVRGPAVCSSTADRDSAITNPYNGLFAITTDTYTLWVRRSSGWERYPRGLLARSRRITTSSTSTSSTAVPVRRVDNIQARAGNVLRVCTGTIHPTSTAAGDNIRVEIRYSTSGVATTASPVLPGARAFELFGNASFGNTTILDTTYTPAVDETISLLLCVARDSGSGNVSLFADGTRVTELRAYDELPDPGNTGTDL